MELSSCVYNTIIDLLYLVHKNIANHCIHILILLLGQDLPSHLDGSLCGLDGSSGSPPPCCE